jgi:adenosylhomocysteine nucleosidase
MVRRFAFCILTSAFPMPTPCDIGIVFALGAEQGGTEDLLTELEYFEAAGFKVRRGKYRPPEGVARSVVLVTSGVGSAAAARATEVLIDGHRPEWIISAGFCGGLVPQAARSDIVAADALHDHAEWTPVVRRHLEKAATAGAPAAKHVGPVVTVDKIIAKSNDKQSLGAATGALACEMESSGVAEVCFRRGVQFLVLRAVSDPVSEDLPSDLEALMKQKSAVGTMGAVLGALWRRPGSAKDMLRLQEHALTTADALAKHLAGVIEKLPLKRPRALAERPRTAEAPTAGAQAAEAHAEGKQPEENRSEPFETTEGST